MIRAGLSLALLALSACSSEQTLVPESQIVGDAIPDALTEIPGNAESGRAIFTDRDSGHCVLCHQVSGLDVPFQGNLGPDLTTVGIRLDPGQLRLRIVDYQRVRPGTVMPSYYRIHDLHQVDKDQHDKPVLSAQEVEDLVAYLSTLGGVE
ncbi:sulfur oxidation c-type cytochrome SoxX [Hyphomonas sp. FCG-A18]|uniref:sulfur oxidation c-type cytochrome SoxX n=1 Tax=Hyphomonas sp. FCG-A18 TaxID=3080019 RepID=UPI002B30B947|nr:sulfur oxidation c-type cytochrome SoxX [Hyphomonas sp. FCG-A18]